MKKHPQLFLSVGLIFNFACTSSEVDSDSSELLSSKSNQLAVCDEGIDPSGGGVGGLISVAPCTPQNLTAANLFTKDLRGIQVAWEDESQKESGYQLERKDSATGEFAVLASTEKNIEFFNDLTAEPNHIYTYRVRALGLVANDRPDSGNQNSLSAGSSLFSNEVEFSYSYLYENSWQRDLTHNGPRSTLFADLDQDGTNEVVIATHGVFPTFGAPIEFMVQVYNSVGTLLWSKTLFGLQNRVTLSIANIDEDPNLEVVVAAPLEVHVYKQDGSYASGWPITLSDPLSYSPVVYQGQNRTLILVPTSGFTGEKLNAYNPDGSLNWVKTLSHSMAFGVAIGDLNGDGVDEIVSNSYDIATGFFGAIEVFKLDGSDFGLTITNAEARFNQPVLADVDGLPGMEIIVSTSKAEVDDVWFGDIYVYNVSGEVLSGWPKAMEGWTITTSVGDLDGDGDVEIIANGKVGEVFAWHHTGENVTGWPVENKNATQFDFLQPLIGDITGDGLVDLLVGDKGCNLMAYHATGAPIEGFPLALVSDPTNCQVWSMALGSFTESGTLQIALGLDDDVWPPQADRVQIIETEHLASTSPLVWPTEGQNMQRTCSLVPTTGRDPKDPLVME